MGREIKERSTLIERATTGLGRNKVPGNFQISTWTTPANTPNNGGKDA